MRISGKVSKVETRQGDFQPDDGRPSVAYDFDVITLLIDGLDPVDVRVDKDKREQLRSIDRGQDITLDVEVPKGTKLRFTRLHAAPAAVKAG